MEAYSDRPRFGLMHHCVYSHDDINLVFASFLCPTQFSYGIQIGLIDDDFSEWLRSVKEDGLLDDTILIVMAGGHPIQKLIDISFSDHGHRFARLRETHQGQLEERLPFYSFTLPKELRDTEEGAKVSHDWI